MGKQSVLCVVLVIPRGQRDGGPLLFFLRLHFVMQLGCRAARTALNTQGIISSLRGRDCPHRDESPASSLASSSASEECEGRLELWGGPPRAQATSRGLAPFLWRSAAAVFEGGGGGCVCM